MNLIDVYQGSGVTTGAIDFLYVLIEQRMTEPEVNISATMPTPEQHRQFVHRRPYRCWYLLEEPAQEARIGYGGLQDVAFVPTWLGYVSATQRNEIGIVLLKEFRGRGFGAQAVRALMAKHEPLPSIPGERRGTWIANVAPGNEYSKHLFEKRLGGRLIQVTYEL